MSAKSYQIQQLQDENKRLKERLNSTRDADRLFETVIKLEHERLERSKEIRNLEIQLGQSRAEMTNFQEYALSRKQEREDLAYRNQALGKELAQADRDYDEQKKQIHRLNGRITQLQAEVQKLKRVPVVARPLPVEVKPAQQSAPLIAHARARVPDQSTACANRAKDISNGTLEDVEINKKRLFVSELSQGTTETQLRSFFNGCSIKHFVNFNSEYTELCSDGERAYLRPAGYALIETSGETEASFVISHYNGKLLNGAKVSIRPMLQARTELKQSHPALAQLQPPARGQRQETPPEARNLLSELADELAARTPSIHVGPVVEKGHAARSVEAELKVTNLPPDFGLEQIRELFKPFAPSAVRKIGIRAAVVEVPEDDCRTAALVRLNGLVIESRPIGVEPLGFATGFAKGASASASAAQAGAAGPLRRSAGVGSGSEGYGMAMEGLKRRASRSASPAPPAKR